MNNNLPVQNRLIIVGNGFDIANKLPTRYTDFMENLLFHKFMLAFNNENGFYEDEYFIIQKYNSCNFQPSNLPENTTPLRDYLEFRIKNAYKFTDSNRGELLINIRKNETNLKTIYFHVKDEFLNQLFDKAKEFNWVDIELEYYHKLMELTINKDHVMGFMQTYSVEKLHQTFQMIQYEFIMYLKTLNYEKFSQPIADIFDFPINYDFNHRKRNRNDESQRPKETRILNCNYTPTLEYYKQKAHWQNEIPIIYIHGEIAVDDNPIIFGYGDETVPSYKKLEDLNNNEYLRFMKNKDYAQTTNYADLISFIEQGAPFEVYILGHSCGLSDRVMLNTIFENESCKSIFIFYHQKEDGTDNFIETYHSISRQFTLEKRAELRKKVKAKSISMPFPQQ